MSATNHTTNLGLPQFLPTDKPSWLGDINGAMLAIDNGYGTQATEIAKANSAAGAASSQSNANQVAIQQANTEIADLQNRVQAIEAGSVTEELDGKVSTLETDVDTINGQIETLDSEITDVKTATNTNTQNLSTLSNNVTNLSNELINVKNEAFKVLSTPTINKENILYIGWGAKISNSFYVMFPSVVNIQGAFTAGELFTINLNTALYAATNYKQLNVNIINNNTGNVTPAIMTFATSTSDNKIHVSIDKNASNGDHIDMPCLSIELNPQ